MEGLNLQCNLLRIENELFGEVVRQSGLSINLLADYLEVEDIDSIQTWISGSSLVPDDILLKTLYLINSSVEEIQNSNTQTH